MVQDRCVPLSRAGLSLSLVLSETCQIVVDESRVVERYKFRIDGRSISRRTNSRRDPLRELVHIAINRVVVKFSSAFGNGEEGEGYLLFADSYSVNASKRKRRGRVVFADANRRRRRTSIHKYANFSEIYRIVDGFPRKIVINRDRAVAMEPACESRQSSVSICHRRGRVCWRTSRRLATLRPLFGTVDL